MIENSERGVTLNKSLAWSVLVGVLGGGIWIGVQVTDAKTGIETLAGRQIEDRAAIRRNTEAVSSLQSSNARIDQRLLNIEQGQSRTEDKVDEMLDVLHRLTAGPIDR